MNFRNKYFFINFLLLWQWKWNVTFSLLFFSFSYMHAVKLELDIEFFFLLLYSEGSWIEHDSDVFRFFYIQKCKLDDWSSVFYGNVFWDMKYDISVGKYKKIIMKVTKILLGLKFLVFNQKVFTYFLIKYLIKCSSVYYKYI